MKTLSESFVAKIKSVFRLSVWLGATVLVVLIVAGPAGAALLVNSYTEVSGNIQTVPGIHHSLTGATMAGAKVSAGESTGLMETVIWSATGGATGEAIGAVLGWKLSLAGESGGNPLVLQGLGTNSIDWIEIDLMPDLQIGAFDDNEPTPGTPGSVGGTNPFLGLIAADSQSILGWDIDVTYRDVVALNASAPEKDLYRGMRIEFTQPFISDDVLSYVADSDAALRVPEPASCLLLLGLSALIVSCHRLRRSS